MNFGLSYFYGPNCFCQEERDLRRKTCCLCVRRVIELIRNNLPGKPLPQKICEQHSSKNVPDY